EAQYWESYNATAGHTYDDSSESLYFGRTTTERFNGSIDEVILFKRVLSAAEIKSLYKIGAAQFKESAGNFLSRVFDSGSSLAWQSLIPTPRAPYDRPVTSLANETLSYPEGLDTSARVAYVPFDEATVNHNSPPNRVADLKTGVRGTMNTGDGSTNKVVAGKFGNALSFDGASGSASTADYVQFSNSGGKYTWNAGQSRT